MLPDTEYSDIVVTVAHPWGNVEVPLEAWTRTGPGPRPYVEIIAARRVSTGENLPMAEIPLEYHNSAKARRLQRRGIPPCPWARI